MSQGTFWESDTPEEERVEMKRVKLPPKGERGLKGLVFPTERKVEPVVRKPRRDFRINKSPRISEPVAERVEATEGAERAEEEVKKEEAMTSEGLAAQLMKLYRMGFVTGPDDPDVKFYARMIVDFGATVIEK